MKTIIVILALLVAQASCAQPSRTDLPANIPSGNLSIDFKRIYFQEGRPRLSEANSDSSFDQKQREVLQGLLDALKANPMLGAEIIGFADKNECLSSECHELSLRRAKVVFDWFIRHGLPAAQLKGPLGESIDWPLDGGETAEGRALNRRVQLEPFPVQSKVEE